ncbi:hypothetical protein ASG29_02390 [Sphingomonas sp. Leaf412]|uniref:hypothetical protein n=1 Tax=Sphingomonas sp. Leaf412 TaxID=1736370 RepID=UPI0006F39B69|nr:hypothetical protein [Sphingomonas sp. Leaf412]KQT35003.1 hypothetical protein ASG29_02390 [Sphingomonas sp. Leaf412]
MTAIDRLSPLAPLSPLAGDATTSAGSAAAQAIGNIGHRVLGWVAAAGGEANGSAAWTARAGEADGFVPDRGVLAQRGDVYGLNQIARDLSVRFGATPTQEGDLRRALEGVARGAMVQAAGLSGADGERQVAGLSAALDSAAAAPAGDGIDGIDGVVARLEAAAGSFARGNG